MTAQVEEEVWLLGHRLRVAMAVQTYVNGNSAVSREVAMRAVDLAMQLPMETVSKPMVLIVTRLREGATSWKAWDGAWQGCDGENPDTCNEAPTEGRSVVLVALASFGVTEVSVVAALVGGEGRGWGE